MAVESPGLIPVTLPFFAENEGEILRILCLEGIPTIHLRKPDESPETIRRFIEKEIPPEFRQNLTLHHLPEIARETGAGGIHLRFSERNRRPLFPTRVSLSCHSCEEVVRSGKTVDYVFLSPIFDSISKAGYRSSFDPEELRTLLDQTDRTAIVALGGIDRNTIGTAAAMGFEGAAVLGALWVTDGKRIDAAVTLENYHSLLDEWIKSK